MPKLKPEKHHWWPKCVSRLWADQQDLVNCLLPSGEIHRSSPANFGVLKNGHHIQFGEESGTTDHWDTSYEDVFQNADSWFPSTIEFLESLDRCGPPFERPISERVLRSEVKDERWQRLIECLVSLAARSPKYREQGVALAEDFRGPLSGRHRNGIIGYNIRTALPNAVKNLGGGGKALVLFSPEREFVFGDGFFQNLTLHGEHWHHPRMFIPVTPNLAVIFVRPIGYGLEPRIFTVSINRSEADELNFSTQAYSRNYLFYRYDKPEVGEEFTTAKHMVFRDHRNIVQRLIHEIPGVPPPDPNEDRLADFFQQHVFRRQ